MAAAAYGATLSRFQYLALFWLGALLGVAQWPLMRSWMRRSGLWAAFSAAGGAFGAAIAYLSLPLVASTSPLIPFTYDYMLAVEGAWLGASQWLLLRKYAPGAGWGVPASALGGAAFGLASHYTIQATYGVLIGIAGRAVAEAAGQMVGGVAYGAITGAVMAWLLRQGAVPPAQRSAGGAAPSSDPRETCETQGRPRRQ